VPFCAISLSLSTNVSGPRVVSRRSLPGAPDFRAPGLRPFYWEKQSRPGGDEISVTPGIAVAPRSGVTPACLAQRRRRAIHHFADRNELTRATPFFAVLIFRTSPFSENLESPALGALLAL